MRLVCNTWRAASTIDGDLVYNPSVGSVWISVDGEKIEIPGGAQRGIKK